MLTEIQMQKKRERRADKRRDIKYRPTKMLKSEPGFIMTAAPLEIVAPKSENLLKRAAGFVRRLWNRKV